MKTVLVPCDFSQQSRAAYRTALEIVSRTSGKVILLHVLYIPTLYTSSLGGEAVTFDPVYFTTMEEDARRELEKMQNDAKAYPVDVKIEVVFGEIISSIKRMIETSQVDMIVMGTTGASGLSEIFIGSNTEKVVRHASVPVIALRKAVKISSVKNILLPSTLDLDQSDFIRKVKELQDFFNATLHILLINTPTNFRRDAEAGEAMEEFAKHYKLKNYKTHFRNYWHEEDGIADFAKNEKMDLIAMGTHGVKGFAHLFLGSTTEDVVNHIEIPVWTYSLKK
ncbi:MAG: universal stress protein [Cyclobacteriaceae bacterium]